MHEKRNNKLSYEKIMELKEKVFNEVCKIPEGETRTYKEIAVLCNSNPRAVAKILSKNKNPIIIPCHRVIRSDGKPGGYTFKGKRKDKMKLELLKKEGIRFKKELSARKTESISSNF